MHFPAQVAKAAKTDLRVKSSLPPVVWSLPALVCALAAVSLAGRPAPPWTLQLLGVFFGFWLFSIYAIHCHVRSNSTGYPVSPVSATLQNFIAGAPAAFIAFEFCSILKRAANQIAELVGDVMPQSLPVAHSAVTLLEQYGVYLAIVIAFGAAVGTQIRLGQYLRAYAETNGVVILKPKVYVATAIIGAALCLPGCVWLLAEQTTLLGPSSQLQYPLMLFAYGCAFVVFALLSWLNKQLEAVEATRIMS